MFPANPYRSVIRRGCHAHAGIAFVTPDYKDANAILPRKMPSEQSANAAT
jgi:hypothetical protein